MAYAVIQGNQESILFEAYEEMTPRGGCACTVGLLHDGEPRATVMLTFCPTHQHAPRLFQAAQEALTVFSTLSDHWDDAEDAITVAAALDSLRRAVVAVKGETT